jgi:hypothetical protein
MAQDLVTVYNLALSAVGTRARVSSPAEETREAQLCRQWYPLVRDMALRAAHWPSCRNVTSLSISAEVSSSVEWAEGDPEPPWLFRYNLPNDFLFPRWLTSYENFELTQHNNILMMLSNAEEPILVYTKRQEIPAAWDVDLYNAIVMGLAGSIAMPLHGKADRARNALEEANMAILRARINQANQNVVTHDAVPDWLLARGVTQQTQFSQFIYQYGPLFSASGLL